MCSSALESEIHVLHGLVLTLRNFGWTGISYTMRTIPDR
jgi:hypothetical protein